jgi:hypothetical protein
MKTLRAPKDEATDKLLMEFKRLDLINQGKKSMKVSITHNVFHHRLIHFDRLIRERALYHQSKRLRLLYKLPFSTGLDAKPQVSLPFPESGSPLE